jgi:predicted YcjX-like family ATPase
MVLSQFLNHIVDRIRVDQHHIVVTGLSRSGKSTLFTSLMAQLLQRTYGGDEHQPLPLLSSLPIERLLSVDFVANDDGTPAFSYQQHFEQLKQRQWPESTRSVSAFSIRMAFERSYEWLSQLAGDDQRQLTIYDYPGEWLMDLPLMDKSFADWSAQVLAQQLTEPQKTHASDWQTLLQTFDFEQAPSPLATQELIDAYRRYLIKAKADGISILQPGAMLFEETWDWQAQGFCPLPAKIAYDMSHAWTRLFTKRYDAFVVEWLQPLQKRFFSHADKQIILLDLLEGLNFGKAYLSEMKEALNHLVRSFVYGKRQWYQRFHQPLGIVKVAFVVTKADLVPSAQQANLLALLQDICQGAVEQLNEKDVAVEFFLVSSMIATKPDSEAHSLVYKHLSGETRIARFDDIPTRITDWKEDDFYPYLKALPPKIDAEADIKAMNFDRLLDYMMKD